MKVKLYQIISKRDILIPDMKKIGVSDLKFNIETYNRDRKKYINFLDTPLAKKRYIILSNYTGSYISVPPQI